MATGFDPYHRWLSIPPSEQPPNHYRLLGLQAFESSVEVIQNAAERQSRHVRSNLRSPLGAHAINLIREIEVARLCLIDSEAKRAYDACLTQRAQLPGPAKAKSVDEPAYAQSPLSFLSTEQSFPAAIVPSFVSVSQHRRKRSSSSPIAFFLMWLASGAIGLLAGYAVLCMIDPQYDFLHVMFSEDRGAMAEGAARSPVVAGKVDNRNRSQPIAKPESRPQRISPLKSDLRNVIEREPQPATVRQENFLADQAMLKGLDPNVNQQLRVGNDLKPIIVPFDLKKRVIRLVSIPDESGTQNFRCNVEGSAELEMAPLVDLPIGGKRDVLFRAGMNDVTVGFELSFVRRSNAIVVEIRPKFRLPSGDEEAFYKLAGAKKARNLSNQVSTAMIAQRSLPRLRSQLNQVTVEYTSVLPVANTPTTTGRYLQQVAAQRRAATLFDLGASLEKQISAAESLSANLPRLEVDLTAVQQLGEWGAAIAKSATLAVSIHSDGVPLIAELK